MAWTFYDASGNALQLTGNHALSSHTGTVDSAEIATGAIDLAHMSVNSIDSDQYVDGSIDNIHLADDAVDSDELAAGAVDLAHMSVNSIDSDQYVDRSIDTVHIGLNQITLAEMAGGTDGNLITYDTNGDPAYVATGNDGQVLTSAGANNPPAFETLAAGVSLGLTIALGG